jgi:membrane-associated protease RseP (regulator of RpoE activity)
MHHIYRKSALTLALALFGGNVAAAQEPAAAAISRELDAALIEVLSRQPPRDQALLIEQPERQRIELGAVIDVRAADQRGLPVLAITPGSAAARIGLAVGDRLIEINGEAVATAVAPGALLQSAVADGDGELALRVQRGDQQLTLTGSADLVAIPAYTLSIAPSASQSPAGCGFVSGGARISDTTRKVEIVAVDGEPADTNFIGRVRLPAGTYRLSVRPRPLPQYAGIEGNLRYHGSVEGPSGPQPVKRMSLPGRGFQDEAAPAPIIEFELSVAPDTSYQLGARPSSNGGKMEAFVWRQGEKPCQPVAAAKDG